MHSTDVTQRGRSFNRADHPFAAAAAAQFCSGFEAGTLRFFDTALPHCDRMVDFGAYFGFTALYAATFGVTVEAFEPCPGNFAHLAANVAANPGLAGRMRLHRHGLGARDEAVMLFAKGNGDSGASVLQNIERAGLVKGAPIGQIDLRDAAAVLRDVGIGPRTLLKIDIEGAEYQVLPAIAGLLAEHRPWLHVSFHPFNLVQGREVYASTLLRLRAACEAAEAVACYRFMHLYEDDGWTTIGPAERMDFLRQYLLKPKALPQISTPQYGFVNAVAFSDEALPANA